MTKLELGHERTTFYTSSPAATGAGYVDTNAGTPFLYTQTTSTNSAAPTPLSNYALFSSLSGTSQTVTIHSEGGKATVGGFQIIAAPEPGSLLLGAVGALALLVLRRRA